MSAILNYILDQQDNPKEEKMILAFKPQFVQPILDGTKIHTIRLAKEGRWVPGRKIHFATGVRTKNYSCFKEGDCISTQQISMQVNSGGLKVSIDGKELSIYELKMLSEYDGFNTVIDFIDWFLPIVQETPFDVQYFTLIHWTDKRY
jgi:hypothetical protein